MTSGFPVFARMLPNYHLVGWGDLNLHCITLLYIHLIQLKNSHCYIGCYINFLLKMQLNPRPNMNSSHNQSYFNNIVAPTKLFYKLLVVRLVYNQFSSSNI